jgi:hypothetical protein
MFKSKGGTSQMDEQNAPQKGYGESNVIFTKEMADKAREILRKKLSDPKQVILDVLSKEWQQTLFHDNDHEEILYQKVEPFLVEIVRRAKERFNFSAVIEIRSYLYGIFDSKLEGAARDFCYRFIDKFLMPPFESKPDSELTWEELEKETEKEILSVLDNQRQPGAGEFLELLVNKFDWRVRHLFLSVIQRLRSDKSKQTYLRDYLKTTLSDKEIGIALRGAVKPEREFKSTLDDLIRQSLIYRKSDAFKEMIEFTAKFRDYAPYNNLLVSIQRPECSFYATEKDWQTRFGRKIKEDATPMLILAPMHPVMLVYDLDSTEGEKPLPKNLTDLCKTEGEWEPARLDLTLENAKRDGVLIQFKELSSTMGGFATSEVHDPIYKMRVVIRKELDTKSCYNVMCHELAHIYLGHLGTDKDNWWPCRINLTHRAVEIEAEAVSYIVGTRLGLNPSSAAYLAGYVAEGHPMDNISVELIAKVSGKLLEMGERKMPQRKSAKK